MIKLTPSEVHQMTVTGHTFIEDPADFKHECLICNAFVTDLIDVWNTEQENIHWFALNNKRAIIEEAI